MYLFIERKFPSPVSKNDKVNKTVKPVYIPHYLATFFLRVLLLVNF